jgi:hypothetical protein
MIRILKSTVYADGTIGIWFWDDEQDEVVFQICRVHKLPPNKNSLVQ